MGASFSSVTILEETIKRFWKHRPFLVKILAKPTLRHHLVTFQSHHNPTRREVDTSVCVCNSVVMMLSQLIIFRPGFIEEPSVPICDFAESAFNVLGRHWVVVVYMNGSADMVVPINLHPVSVTVNVYLAWIDGTRVVREDDTMGNIDRIVAHLVEEPLKKLLVNLIVMIPHYHDLVTWSLIHR